LSIVEEHAASKQRTKAEMVATVPYKSIFARLQSMKNVCIPPGQHQCSTGFWQSAASVMPAWIARIQARRMRPDTSI
jgi:hypothetical protein